MTTERKGPIKLKFWRLYADPEIADRPVRRFGKRKTQSEMVENAFRMATKRTGMFASRHAKQ